jgi:protein-S-isoprenylcysteine O-methyltransferase Ste14
MNFLELKIPPPLVAIAAAAVMWAISRAGSPIQLPIVPQAFVAVALVVIGFAFDIAGLMAFRRARTTVNPMKPELVSSFVSSGIYRVTRNPMYVGLVFILLAWAVYLASPWSLLGLPGFMLYTGRFQIQPEERFLQDRFGDEYRAYTRRVRRWL